MLAVHRQCQFDWAIFQFHLCRHPEHPKHVVQIAVIRHTSLHADTQHVRVVI